MKTTTEGRYIISVLVADRPGILRDITAAVTGMNANIDGISQTVVEGYFTVILTATLDRQIPTEDIRDAILGNFAGNEASVVVRPYGARPLPLRAVEGQRYVVTLTGKDRIGIIKAVTTFLASKGINVEDWYVEFAGENGAKGTGTEVTHVGEITIPSRLDIKQIQQELRQIAAKLGLVISIQHENIFKATSELGPMKSLLGGRPNGKKG